MSADLGRERLAVLVHEVRSPVAALAAVAEAAGERDAAPALRAELVRLALAACESIERIVVDIALSSVRLEALDVRAVVREAVAAFRVRGADVVVELDDSGPLVVDADAVRLRQALDNLVENALLHGGSSESVRVSVARSGVEARIAVADAGVGIPRAELQRVFERGVRLDTASRGSGLGLAVTHAVVDALGGSVAVESTEGVGATFTIVLPLAGSQPATRASTT